MVAIGDVGEWEEEIRRPSCDCFSKLIVVLFCDVSRYFAKLGRLDHRRKYIGQIC